LQLPNSPFQTNRLQRQPLSGTVSLGDTLGNVLDETFQTNPTQSIRDMNTLSRARRGEVVGTVAAPGPFGASEAVRDAPETPYVSVEEQERRIQELGLNGRLTPYEGETEEGLSMRIRWKQDEIARQNVSTNSGDGIGTTLLSFAAGLGGSLLDPLNIASGFVPVVGPARYARMLSEAGGRLGRLGVRSRIGAAEGAVGSVLVEPIVMAGASAREADYTLYDSVANIVFGTIMGGGLHSVGGAALDEIDGGASWRQFSADVDALSPQERRDVQAAGVAAVASGHRPIVTEHLVRDMLARAEGRNSRADLQSSTARVGPYTGAPHVEGLRGDVTARSSEGTESDGATTSVQEPRFRTERRDVELPEGGTLSVPDAPHAELLNFALDLEAGNGANMTARRRDLFETFHGHVEHDPDAGQPFAEVGDVDDLARDYLDQARDTGDDAGSIVSPDAGDAFTRILADRDREDVQAQRVKAREDLSDAARRAQDPQNRIFADEQRQAADMAAQRRESAPRINEGRTDETAALEAEVDRIVAEVAEESADNAGARLNKPKPSTRSRQVANDVRRQLVEIGRDADEAAAEAQVHGAFANVLEQEYGADPQAVYEGLEIARGGQRRAGGNSFDQEARGSTPYEGDTIEVDGVERTTVNSNGQPIAQTQEGLEAFWRWFGDSKVVDDEGRPLMVYHGTKADFDSFADPNSERNDAIYGGIMGFHFGTKRAASDRLRDLGDVDSSLGRESGQPNVMPVYIRIENTLRMQDMADRYVRRDTGEVLSPDEADSINRASGEYSKRIERGEIELSEVPDEFIADDGDLVEIHGRMWEEPEDVSETLYEMGILDIDAYDEVRGHFAFIKEELRSKGIDGIVYENHVEGGGGDSFIVFDPTQIKSIHNRGTFDAEDPRILNQDQPTVEIAGDEFGVDVQDRDALRKAARAHYSTLQKGPGVPNAELGQVKFSRTGKGKSLKGPTEQLQAIAKIEDIVRNGRRRAPSAPDEDGRENVKAWHYMETEVTVGGRAYKALFDIREDNNGHYHYELFLKKTDGRPVSSSVSDERLGVDLEQPSIGNIGADGSEINLRLEAADGADTVGNPRGRITFDENRTLIEMFEGADASTFLHESGHFFVETMLSIEARGNAPARLTEDLAVLRRYAGVADGQRFSRNAHETVARAFEAYLREGRAPDEGLAAVFGRIRDWLVQVYRNVRDLDVELTDEVRGVFDRMLATDEQLGRGVPRELRAEMDAADFRIATAQSRAKAMAQAATCVLRAM